MQSRRVFFLGGRDLEMATIRELLAEHAPGRFHDKGLSWGAKTSDYRKEIGSCLERGETPVLVELADDMGLATRKALLSGRRCPGFFDEIKDDLGPAPRTAIIIDHHGERAGEDRPTSLHQVFELLGLSKEMWTRWLDLVAANDRGYIQEMVKLGATREEIEKVRAADRAAQGITPEEEAEAERAVASSETLGSGALTVVRLSHSRTAAVADRFQPELGGPGYRKLLVVSPDQVNFFGSGEIVTALDKQFPGGWYGGGLPKRGFWGHGEPVPDAIPFLLEGDRARGQS